MRNKLTLLMTTRDGVRTRQDGHTLTILCKQVTGNWVLVRDANLLSMQV